MNPYGGYPPPFYPIAPPTYQGAALPVAKRKLPGSVRAAGIMMISFGSFYMLLVTLVIIGGEGSTALWVNVLSYVIAAFSVVVPILMLMGRRWAYSMSVSILVATVLLFALEVIGSGLWFQIKAFPLVVILISVFALIYGLPLMLLMGKSARRAFEGARNQSATVWAGGGWQWPGTEPFAYHPSEMPASLMWMRAMGYSSPSPMPTWPPQQAWAGSTGGRPQQAWAGGASQPPVLPVPGQWPPSVVNPGGMQYSS